MEEHRTRSILDETSRFDVRVVTFGRALNSRVLSRIFSAAFCLSRHKEAALSNARAYVSHVSLCEMSFNET